MAEDRLMDFSNHRQDQLYGANGAPDELYVTEIKAVDVGYLITTYGLLSGIEDRGFAHEPQHAERIYVRRTGHAPRPMWREYTGCNAFEGTEGTR